MWVGGGGVSWRRKGDHLLLSHCRYWPSEASAAKVGGMKGKGEGQEWKRFNFRSTSFDQLDIFTFWIEAVFVIGRNHGNFYSFFFNWVIVALQWCVGFCCTMKWISYIRPLPLEAPCHPPIPHPTPLGHHRPPSWAPCATRQVPASYLFHTRQCL